MSELTLLPGTARQARAWKNGGGTTTDIAVFPAGAGMEDFDWRLSMASVTERGPFSHFAGVDRILAVIEGRLELAFAATTIELGPDSLPHAFPGEGGVIGAPVGGRVVDLNLMMRRGRWTGTMERVALPRSLSLDSTEAIVVFIAEGRLRRDAAIIPAQPLDAIRIHRAQGESVAIEGEGVAYVIGLSSVA
jgi:environmental stress-induced protein Ves